MLIEKLSGVSYNEYLQANIVKPALLENTAYLPTSRPPNMPSGFEVDADYNPSIETNFQMSWAHAAGGIYSTVDDMLKWDLALFSNKIINQNSLEKMLTPGLENYGFGWSIIKRNSYTVISHSGGLPGFTSFNLIIPEKQINVITLCNTTSSVCPQIATAFAKLLLEGFVNLNEEEVWSEKEINELVGKYKSPDLEVRILNKSENLYFQFDDKMYRIIKEDSQNGYLLLGVRFKIIRDENGLFKELIVQQSGAEIVLHKVDSPYK